MNMGFGAGWLAIVTVVFIAPLLLLAIVSTLADRGRIQRNFFFGSRMPQVKLRWIGLAGALVCAVVGIFLPPAHRGVVAVFVVAVAWTFTVAVRAADASA